MALPEGGALPEGAPDAARKGAQGAGGWRRGGGCAGMCSNLSSRHDARH